MARIEKTVFISYRRTDVYTALAVYENLKNQGYDVFFDYRSIPSGDFEQIITSNIKARAHFLLILTPTALDRCNEPGDWLRREIEIAIEERRNIVPLFFRGFRFGDPAVTGKLTGKLQNLNRYNGLNVHEDYFDEAMLRVRTQFLKKPLNTVLHPVSTEVQKVVIAEKVAADQALEKIEDVQELVKQPDEKLTQLPEPDPIPALAVSAPVKTPIEKQPETPAKNVDRSTQHEGIRIKTEEIPQEDATYLKPILKKTESDVAATQNSLKKAVAMPDLSFRLIGGIIGGILLFALFIWGGANILKNQPMAAGEATRTSQIEKTQVIEPSKIYAPLSTKTLMATKTVPTNTPESVITPLGIGSTMVDKDGMTLLYVPAGEFTMGNDDGSDAEPANIVYLDAFWIDQTEVTNKQYAFCVTSGACIQPLNMKSPMRSSYYGDYQFQNYPVVYVDWYMAKAYCEWTGRRLPTEAEWEKAARGTDGRIYPWGNSPPNDTLLNYNSPNRDTTQVGKYPNGRSPYDAYDMAGNVWEWVSSLHLPYPYDKADERENLAVYGDRVLRGGAWYHLDGSVRPLLNAPYDQPDILVRTDQRNWFAPKYENISEYGRPPFGFGTVGFRCAMDATQ